MVHRYISLDRWKYYNFTKRCCDEAVTLLGDSYNAAILLLDAAVTLLKRSWHVASTLR